MWWLTFLLLARADIGERMRWVQTGPLPNLPMISGTPVSVIVDWNKTLRTTTTSAQIEVDVMPFLGRTHAGGNFNDYYEALSNLGAESVM